MKEWADILIRFFAGLIPQRGDGPDQIYDWRWKSVILGMVTLGIGVYAADWLPFIPTPYAMASAVQQNKDEIQGKFDSTNKKLDDISGKLADVLVEQHNSLIRQMNTDLIDARRYQCRAMSSPDKSTLSFWNSRIQTLRLQYQQITGEIWPDQDCNSF